MNPAEVAKSVSEAYAEFGLGLRYDRLPPEVVSKAKDHLLDTIGCGLRGSTTDYGRAITSLVLDMGGPPESTIIGNGSRVAAGSAALANGTICSCLDFDDTGYWAGSVHSSRALVPTFLSLAEMMGRSGQDLITATVAGWEIANRVGNAQGVDRERRYDVEAYKKIIKRKSVGSNHFGAAAGAGLLLGLDRDQISSAIGFAAFMDGGGLGTSQSHREGTDAMPLSTGWTAHAGIVAAMAVKKGLMGPRLIFEGDKGFFSVLALGELFAPEKLTEGLGARWYTMDNCIKFYPGGHGIHHFIESLKTVIRDNQVRAEDVEEVVCHVPNGRAESHFEFAEQKLNPRQYDSRFSMPFILATVLVDGDWNVDSPSPAKLKDPRRLELARRVHCSIEVDSWKEENRGSITVKTRNGMRYEAKHPRLLGLPSNLPSHRQIVEKFRLNASAVLTRSATDKLVKRIETLEGAKSVADVMLLTVP